MKQELITELQTQARFESLFTKTNMTIGLAVWARSTGLVFMIAMAMDLLGITSLVGGGLPGLMHLLTFYLIQRAVAQEAARRYQMQVLGTAWWSVFWRVTVFTAPISLALAMMIVKPGLQMEEMMLLPEVQTASMLVTLISIIPTGLATSRALLVSQKRISATQDFNFSMRSDDNGQDVGKEEQETGEDSPK